MLKVLLEGVFLVVYFFILKISSICFSPKGKYDNQILVKIYDTIDERDIFLYIFYKARINLDNVHSALNITSLEINNNQIIL